MTLTWLGVPLCDGNRLGNLALEEVADGWRALLEVSDDRVTQRICIAKGDSANIDQLTRAWIASFAQLVDGNARADARLERVRAKAATALREVSEYFDILKEHQNCRLEQLHVELDALLTAGRELCRASAAVSTRGTVVTHDEGRDARQRDKELVVSTIRSAEVPFEQMDEAVAALERLMHPMMTVSLEANINGQPIEPFRAPSARPR